MDLKKFLKEHEERGADVSIACTRVGEEAAKGFGIMKVDSSSTITDFIEKPQTNLQEWKIPETSTLYSQNENEQYLASMSIQILESR